MGFIERVIRWFRSDQALHRSFVVMVGHELIDGLLFIVVAIFGGLALALGAWALSFVSGIFIGHFTIEAHDKHGDEHRPMAKVNTSEAYLWEGKFNELAY